MKRRGRSKIRPRHLISNYLSNKKSRASEFEVHKPGFNFFKIFLIFLKHFSNFLSYILFDAIINEMFSISKHPIREISNVIECFAIKTRGEDLRAQKSTDWILHYIKNNALDKVRMQCVFEACSNIDLERRLEFISCFLKCNNDFELFKSLPLTDYPSDGWSGSIIRVYNSWVEYYKKLLPLLSSLQFINHKKLIENRIDNLQKDIVNAEVSDILENSDNR